MKSTSVPLLLCGLLWCLPALSEAQCPAGDVLMESQADVSSFGATFPSCTVLPAGLTMTDPNGTADPITNLSPLASLVTIDGTLDLNRTTVLSGLALPNLQGVGGDLLIQFNDGLTSVALSQLAQVTGDLVVGVNPLLASLDFGDLLSIGEIELEGPEISAVDFQSLSAAFSLDIHSTSALESVGFPALETLGGSLLLQNNQALLTVAFPELTEIDGTTQVLFNPVLQSLVLPMVDIDSGFDIVGNDSLHTVSFPSCTTCSFSIEDNPQLGTLDLPLLESPHNVLVRDLETLTSLAMPSLSSVTTFLTIRINPELVDLDLSALQTVGEHFTLDVNSSLSNCCSLLPFLTSTDPSFITLQNNTDGCNSIQQVVDGCQVIFADGFESGDLTAWSSAFP